MRAVWVVVVLAVVAVARAQDDDDESLEDTVKTLKGQVSALLERRQEDYRLLEQSLRHSVEKSTELASLRAELDKLRQDVRTETGRKNEQLTAQWVTASVSELRAELLELARAHNDSQERAARSDLRAQVRLARQDSAALRSELERLRAEHGRTAADLAQMRQEATTLRAMHQVAAKKDADTRQQLQTLQNEWNAARRDIKEGDAPFSAARRPHPEPEDNKLPVLELQREAPLRHHHLVRAQIAQLAAETRALKESHLTLRKQLRRVERQMRPRLERVTDDAPVEDRDAGAEVQRRLAALENATQSLTQSVWNASRRVAEMPALRASTLQLLESLTTLESKVETNVPSLQREISRLEFALAQVRAVAHENKEDQENQRASLKAMAASLSTLQERTAADHALLGELEEKMRNTTVPNGHQPSLPDLQVADDPAVPRLVEELSQVQAEYENILHKLPRDCSDVRGISGEYLVAADGEGAPLMVPCDQLTERGGWTVLQRRADGSQDFNRKWEEYAKGFGPLTGEFWLGNEALHRLTSDGCMELRVELADIYNQRWLAEYDQFVVGGRQDGFRLAVSGYRGNASDALNYQTGMEFSAPDRDRDSSHTHCAQNYEGGWWFSHCQHANLNGRYNLGLTWFQADRNEWIAVASSELKIRRQPNCVRRPLPATTSAPTVAPITTPTPTAGLDFSSTESSAL